MHVKVAYENFDNSVPTDSQTDTESAVFSESVCHQKHRFFAAMSDSIGSSVYETLFTYQVVVFKRHCFYTAAAGRYRRLIGSCSHREEWGRQWH